MSSKPVRLPRQSKGKRPTFFSDPGIDQLYSIVLELSAELSVALDRIDSLERLLDEKELIALSETENYRPSEAADAERAARRDAYLARIFRVLSYTDTDHDEAETSDE